MLLHFLAKHKNTKITPFHSNAPLHAMQDFNHSLLDFFNLDDLQLIFALLSKFCYQWS